MDLDERIASAVAALEAAIDSVPPNLDDRLSDDRLSDEGAPAGRGRVLVAAAVAIVAITAAFIVAVRAGDDRGVGPMVQVDPTPPATAIITPIGAGGRRLTWVPAGYALLQEDGPGGTHAGPSGVEGAVEQRLRLGNQSGQTIDVWVLEGAAVAASLDAAAPGDFVAIPLGPMRDAQGRVDSLGYSLDDQTAVVIEGRVGWDTMIRLAVGLVPAWQATPPVVEDRQVDLPDLVGMDYRDAIDVLIELGLRPQLQLHGAPPESPAGTVTAVPASSPLAVGSTVVLGVSAPKVESPLDRVQPDEPVEAGSGEGFVPWSDGTPPYYSAGYSLERLQPLLDMDPPLVPGTDTPEHQPIVFLHGELIGYVLEGRGQVVRIEHLVDPAFVPATDTVTTFESGPAPVPPSDDPARVGWTTFEVNGIALDHPPSWSVVSEGCPGARATSIFVGHAAADCAAPDPSGAWIWVEPDAADLETRSIGCSKGRTNDMSTCTHHRSHEEMIVDGLGVIVSFGSTVASPELATITGSIRYAVGSAPVLSDQEPIWVAHAFVTAWYAGDCPEVERLMSDRLRDDGLQPACTDARAGLPRSAEAGALTPMGGSVTVTMELPDGSHDSWDLGIVVGWSTQERASVFRVDSASRRPEALGAPIQR